MFSLLLVELVINRYINTHADIYIFFLYLHKRQLSFQGSELPRDTPDVRGRTWAWGWTLVAVRLCFCFQLPSAHSEGSSLPCDLRESCGRCGPLPLAGHITSRPAGVSGNKVISKHG